MQVTFLPLLSEPCSFDLLVYTNKVAKVPKKWEDSDARYIINSQEVKLRSFTTSVSLILVFDIGCLSIETPLLLTRFSSRFSHCTDSQGRFNGYIQGGRRMGFVRD
jgi:hypothetical protein